MKKTACYLLATLSLIVILTACTTTTSPTKTSLWKVSSAQRTVYIASSAGVLASNDYPLPMPFSKAFAASDRLYLEHNPHPGKGLQASIHASILKQGKFSGNKTLEDVMTPAQIATVKAAVTKNGAPFSHLKETRPWLLVLAWNKLEPKPAPPSRHAGKTQHLSAYFYAKAKARSIAITPLESYARLFDLLSSLPMKTQVNHLMHVIKPDDENKDQPAKLRKLVKAWRSGNTATVLALSGNYKDMSTFRQVMVHDRNQAWVNVLEGKLHTQGKPIFVVVGDAHVMGQDNMLALLRNDGFQVRQL